MATHWQGCLRLFAPLFLLMSLFTMLAKTAKAQVRPEDFDVPDGKIESAAGNRLMVSTKEMRATLKFKTAQSLTSHFHE